MIFTFAQSGLHNEEHFQHKTEVKDVLEESPEVTKKLGSLYTVFAQLYLDEDRTLEHIAKSDLTQQIDNKDVERDDVTRGLFLLIDANVHHYDPKLRAEAISLKNIRDHYRGITHKNVDEQTGTTHNFLQDLEAKSETLKSLSMTGWVDRLKTLNKEVYELVKDRDEERSKQVSSRIKDVRPQVDKALDDIYGALRTFALLTPQDEGLTSCINLLNVVNKRYSDKLDQRAGQAAASQKKKA